MSADALQDLSEREPPKCSFGHETTEMEQITAPRWRGEDSPDA